MSVYKTPKSPYFQYDFQFKGRRYHGSTGCDTKRAAEEFERKVRREATQGLDGKPEITLDDACALYLDHRGKHLASVKTVEYQIINLVKMLGPNKFLSDIGDQEFLDYVRRRRAKVSNASVNRELQLARRIWKFLAPNHNAPVLDWGKLLLNEPRGRSRELTADEEKRLFENLPDSIRDVVEFAILSGQRKSSIISLEWERVDLANRLATVWVKGGRWHTFPLTDRLVQIITAQPVIDKIPQVFTYVCERPSPTRKDRPGRRKGVRYPFSVQGWKRKWEKALTDAKIKDFRFHDLRHTAASRLVRASGNIKHAQSLLGHTEIGTTSRYTHVIDDDVRRAMDESMSRNSPGQTIDETKKV